MEPSIRKRNAVLKVIDSIVLPRSIEGDSVWLNVVDDSDVVASVAERYIGRAVFISDTNVGALKVLFQYNFVPEGTTIIIGDYVPDDGEFDSILREINDGSLNLEEGGKEYSWTGKVNIVTLCATEVELASLNLK